VSINSSQDYHGVLYVARLGQGGELFPRWLRELRHGPY